MHKQACEFSTSTAKEKAVPTGECPKERPCGLSVIEIQDLVDQNVTRHAVREDEILLFGLVVTNVGAVRTVVQTDLVLHLIFVLCVLPFFSRFDGLVDLDERGYYAATEDCLTKTPGVFVAGDCRRKPLRQIVTAASDGAVAAYAAEEYLS